MKGFLDNKARFEDQKRHLEKPGNRKNPQIFRSQRLQQKDDMSNIGRLGHLPHNWSYCITNGKCIYNNYKIFKMHIYIYVYLHIIQYTSCIICKETFLFKQPPQMFVQILLGTYGKKPVLRLRTLCDRERTGPLKISNHQATCVDMVCIYLCNR